MNLYQLVSVACLFLAGMSVLPAQASRDTFQLIHMLSVKARFATADPMGQMYLVNEAGDIEKYGVNGRLLGRFSYNKAGLPTAIDASNPLKVMVWYADFRLALFLDRNLTFLGEMNMAQIGQSEARTAGVAADGNIWIYDETAFQLRKISPEGAPLLESQPLNAFLTGSARFLILRDDGRQILAADSSQGLALFDVYGQYVKTFPLKNVRDAQVKGRELRYLAADSLLRIASFEGPPVDRAIPLPPAALQATHRSLTPQGFCFIADHQVFYYKYP